MDKKDYSQNCDFDDDSGKNDCWHCIHFLFPIGCMYGEDGDVKMPHNRRNKPLYSMKEICEMNGVKYEDGDINETRYILSEVNQYMNYAIGDVYILLEDLDMRNDNYGFRTGGGTAKAGQRFELLDLPDRKKKKYTLLSLDVKFPYHLYLRENDFERLFIKEFQ